MAQWSRDTRDFLSQEKSLYETCMQADKWGDKADWRPDFTSKNRLKTSDPQTVFFNTFGFTINDGTWDTKTIGLGTAYINNNQVLNTETFDPASPGLDSEGNTAIITEKTAVLRVENVNDRVIRQTYKVIPYIPGKEQFVSIALRFDVPTTGIRRRAGLFDDDNGAFFEDSGEDPANYYLCVRKNGVETVRVARPDWNGDPLDGTGRSGIVADSLKQQLIGIEYEWYGTGMVRFGYVIDNELHIIHTVYNANNTVGTWAKTPFLPLRMELEALPTYVGAGTSAYFYQSSSSVIAEGGIESLGTQFTRQNELTVETNGPDTGKVTIDAGTSNIDNDHFKPIISFRLKDIAIDGVVSPQKLEVQTPDNIGVYFHVVRNANLVGASFTGAQVAPYSAVEIDESATDMTYSLDQIVAAGSCSGNATPTILDLSTGGGNQFQLGRIAVGSTDFKTLESDVYTVAAISDTGPTKGTIISFTWKEQP